MTNEEILVDEIDANDEMDYTLEASTPDDVDLDVEDTTEPEFIPGYHTVPIQKGTLGEISKILEEFSEFCDACNQGSRIMQLIELSDLLGAIEAYLASMNLHLGDLDVMKNITKRAFENGART
jgi:phosphoribosyl-ATP pyrophosphohydrolase